MHKIFISNVGFGQSNTVALSLLKGAGEVLLNEEGRRLTEDELIKNLANSDILIAGTEKITKRVLENAPKLKLIARIGVGLDSIDLVEAKKRGIQICYTPDAPVPAIVELTICFMIALLRNVVLVDRRIRQGEWFRPMGRQLSDLTLGVVGVGRIGQRLIQQVSRGFPGIRILAHDPIQKPISNVAWCDFDDLLSESDMVTLHVPFTTQTKLLIGSAEINRMKRGGYLLNTSRGGIVDEEALCNALQSGHLAGAALDVFEREPYQGALSTQENCILTSHIGAMTKEVRSMMEQQAAEDVVRFLKREAVRFPISEHEYVNT